MQFACGAAIERKPPSGCSQRVGFLIRHCEEPVRERGLIALLKSMTPLDEEFPRIDDSVPAPERAP